MFDLPHILYMLITAILTAIGLIAAARFCKTQSQKDRVLKISAVVTVIVHYSNLWVDYFSTGSAQIENNHILPVFPCNIMMWFLLIAAFLKNRESTFAVMLSEFVFWGGTICGTVGIMFNFNYDNTPNLLDYDIFKGLFSHNTMVFGCIYMLVGKYIRVRVFNAASVTAGLLFFIADGAVINTLFSIFNLPSVNAMFLQEPPIPQLPFLSVWVLGGIVVIVFTALLMLYEYKCFPPEERWYIKFKNYQEQRKNKRI